MQDASPRQKSVPKFVIPVSANEPETKSRFFEILPESAEQRKKITAQFSQDEVVIAPSYDTKVDATKASSKLPELLLNAQTLFNHGEKELARILVYEALKIDSKNPLALKKAKLFLNPEKDLSQLLGIQVQICHNELAFENYAELGHLYYRNGDDEKALNSYHECLNLVFSEDQALFEVYKNMGNILTKSGDFDGAEEFFHKAFTISPDSDVLSVNLGTLAIQRNDFQSALERFRSAVTRNPKNDTAWVGLALVHQEMTDTQLAFANIETAIDLNPSNRTAVQLYANWCVRELRFQNAIEVVENYLAQVECDVDLSLVLIHLFCKTNRFDLAKLEAQRVLLWIPDDARTLAVQSELAQFKKDLFYESP